MLLYHFWTLKKSKSVSWNCPCAVLWWEWWVLNKPLLLPSIVWKDAPRHMVSGSAVPSANKLLARLLCRWQMFAGDTVQFRTLWLGRMCVRDSAGGKAFSDCVFVHQISSSDDDVTQLEIDKRVCLFCPHKNRHIWPFVPTSKSVKVPFSKTKLQLQPCVLSWI